jgi:diguanylate cyclase (GGDEF)-like protein/PAS domain S-box-containing protein
LGNSVGIPLVVVSRSDDHTTAINSALRDGGHPVHCARVNARDALEALLAQQSPELVLLFPADSDMDIAAVATLLATCSPRPPLVLVASAVDEPAIAAAMEAGARDVVSLTHRNRLQAVISRELHAYRLQLALAGVVRSAHQYKEDLRSLMSAASEAIVEVQEGIVTAANPAWASLLGWPEADELVGQPFMDLFREADQSALKGALIACLRGKWQEDGTLPVVVYRRDETELPLALVLRPTTVDGDPAVRVTVDAAEEPVAAPAKALATAVATDPVTGFLYRQNFLDQLAAAVAQPLADGVRALAYIRPDHFSRVQGDVGVLGTDTIIARLGASIRDTVHPGDICGRFGGTLFTVLLERGTLTDVRAWADQLRKVIADRVFEVETQSTSLTCTVGISEARGQTAEELISDAEQACRGGRDQGGNRSVLSESASITEKLRQTDGFWVARIRSALMQNRLRLIHQPVVGLQEEIQGVVDTRVRLIDEQGDIIRPADFIPPAERAHLMKNIDRWVIGASFSFCAARQPGLVFIRLSRDSILDNSLVDWLRARAASTKLRAGQVCFQVSEDLVLQQLKEVKALSNVLQEADFLFAVDHLGTGRDSVQLLDHVSMQFVKIDGSLMQGLHRDKELQRRVGDIARRAGALGIKTIAERVENASTMAILWQLGVAFVQGNYTQTHGVVLGAGDEPGQQVAG